MLLRNCAPPLAAESFSFDAVTPVVVQNSNDKQTIGGLFRLHDGNEVEAVLMQHFGERNTRCASRVSRAARTRARSARPARPDLRVISRPPRFSIKRGTSRAASGAQARSPTLCSGMANRLTTTPVMDAVRLLNDAHGFGLGHRRTSTISTVGVVPRSISSRRKASRSTLRSRCTRRLTTCARRSCP